MGPYAAWMPRKSLHGRTCGVSHAGARASALHEPKHSHRTDRRCMCGLVCARRRNPRFPPACQTAR
ncbi:hypothetical protein XhhCFBP4925_03165 [Xanthomonas hortorum pv. hederae]|nr:hypothetical protein XhhCFBP4925_03165 [Xanthomonas hortorum pv. hederae]PUF01583.1 hypothetical protein C7T87_02565 [Xanthomonas hortorum pv. hederae]